jgi:glycosyltransferase involved in cell wall biosynthesis
MRILMICLNPTGRGTYWRALHFGRYLVRRGHAVTLIATAPQERFKLREYLLDGVRIVESPDLFRGSLRSGWDPWNTLRRILWARGQEFDLVHAFEARPTVIYPALYLRRRGIPLVMDWCDWFGRGGSVEERPNPLVRTILRPVETFYEEHFRAIANGTTVICTTLREKAIALGVPPESIRLLPNGSDIERFQPLATAEARQGTGLPDDAFVIGYVGRIFTADAELLVKAFDQVAAQIPGVRLLMAGNCPLDLRKMVQRPEAVVQTGPLSDAQVNRYLASCDLFWLPLRDTNANRGRWPLKLNDYLAVGRPVVATAVGDVAPLFEEEEIGLACPDQAEPFAAQTVRLFQDAERRGRMSQRARQVAETRFSWDRLTGQLEALYQTLFHQIQPRS